MHLVEQRIQEKGLPIYHWSLLSGNPQAIPLLEKHPEKIDWNRLSGNENGIWLIQKYLDQKIPQRNPLEETYPQDFRKSAEIDWYKLSKNPNAIPLLEKYPQNINKLGICFNPNAMHIIRELFYPIVNPDWSLLSANPNPEAISFLEKHSDPKWLDYGFLSMNPAAIHLLEKDPDIICYPHLCMNPKALPLLEKNLDKVVWTILSREPFAVELLEKHLDKVDWNQLSVNPGAVPLLEKHLDKVDWGALCINPNAVDLLQNNMDTFKSLKPFDWSLLSRNPGIFELDYTVLRKRMDVLREELLMEALHPRRIARLLELTGGQLDGFI